MSDDTTDAGFLRQEFDRLRAELEALAGKLGANARAAAIEDGFEHLGAALKDGLKTKGKDAMTALEHEIRDRPLAAVAIAFGVGVLAAQLLRRS